MRQQPRETETSIIKTNGSQMLKKAQTMNSLHKNKEYNDLN